MTRPGITSGCNPQSCLPRHCLWVFFFLKIDVMYRASLLSQALFHVVTDLDNMFTVRSKSGLPNMPSYKHSNTIYAHTGASSPVVLKSVGLRSRMPGPCKPVHSVFWPTFRHVATPSCDPLTGFAIFVFFLIRHFGCGQSSRWVRC